MDKELKFGCIARTFDSLRICNGKHSRIGYGEKYEGNWTCMITEEEDEDRKIIGQYHLGSIIDRVIKNHVGFGKYEDGSGESMIFYISSSIRFIVDITKPPMERTEEQNKKLVEFMEKFHCN